ncbi:MAG: glycosyltransferase [bacterium]
MTKNTPYIISVLIPALNESGNIKELIGRIKNKLSLITDHFEIIVVDGGSHDNTQELARLSGAAVIKQHEKGYGAALKEGISMVQGEYIITMDADFSHDPYFIQEMWNKRDLSQVTIASRYVSCGSSDAPFIRNFLSRILNRMFSLLLHIPIKDFSSGFRMYKRDILQSVKLETNDYEVLEEILIKLYCEGYHIAEIPFHYSARQSGKSKAHVLGLMWKYLRTLWRMWKLRNSVKSADYDSRAHDSKIWLQRYWQRSRYKIIQHMLRDITGSVADIGCGSSKIIQHNSMLCGLDIKLNKLRYVRRLNPKVLQGDIFHLPFKNNSLDGLVCSEVIEHIPQDKRIFEEFNRVLKTGGILVIGTPDYAKRTWRFIEFFYNLILPNAYGSEHITQYTGDSLSRLLISEGYTILETEYICNSELILKVKKITA